MDIVLLTLAPFPEGNVSTLRYSSYLMALAKNGDCTPHVIIYSPTSMAKKDQKQEGVVDGIHFRFATRPTLERGSIFEKVVFLLIGLVNTLSCIRKISPKTVILYGDNPWVVTILFGLYCRAKGIRFIGDRSELPTVEERKSKLKMFWYNSKQRLFDGMIIMTKQLCEFYQKYSSKPDFIFFMPMTIDVNRFNGIMPDKKPYIATVFGTHNRDGLEDTIKQYIKYVKEQNGIWNLLLIGYYDNMPNKQILDSLIDESGISNRIHINGPATLAEVPQLLSNASCLLTTPTSYVSGGFPTKLGEYMLSGTPIVATIAGELLDYIEPNVDMLMCYPHEMDKVSLNLKYIETHEVEAIEFAYCAKQKALKFFDASAYEPDLYEFLIF